MALFREIYASKCGTVILGRRGRVFCVAVAADSESPYHEYGPYTWREALALYRNLKTKE